MKNSLLHNSSLHNPLLQNICVAAFIAVAVSACSQETGLAGVEDGALLAGRVVSLAGEPLAGLPVRAREDGASFAVVVYTDQSGIYSFPEWSDLTAGTHSVSITLPDFEQANAAGTVLSEGETARVDFTLSPRQPTFHDATTSEIIAALPGTDEQKVLLAQCNECHTLQTALATPSGKPGWMAIVRYMMGEVNAIRDSPGAMTFNQRRFLEPLADYLTTIRGPESSDDLPFELRPRPTDPESTNLVITEYDVPRGGQAEPRLFRGDRRFSWPHDVIVDDQYAYYTDHFSYVLGRLDKRTGEVVELPYELPEGAGRDEAMAQGQDRAGNPGGGSHDMKFDSAGNVLIGMRNAIVRYNPRTEAFDSWEIGRNMFGIDANDHVWLVECYGALYELNTNNGEITEHTIPQCGGVYDMDTAPDGRTYLNGFRSGVISVFDPRDASYVEYPLPTPGSGPRRGEVDAEGNLWVAENYGGLVARVDGATGEIVEYPVISGSGAYTAPYAAPYSTAVDNENRYVWTTDDNLCRLFRLDMETGASTEYFLPGPYEMRDLTVETGTERPTLWIPSYRPPSAIVKVQLR